VNIDNNDNGHKVRIQMMRNEIEQLINYNDVDNMILGEITDEPLGPTKESFLDDGRKSKFEIKRMFDWDGTSVKGFFESTEENFDKATINCPFEIEKNGTSLIKEEETS
jgi:hypothetical protein